MNEIVIQVRGPQGSGKTTTLRALLGAIHDAGLLDETSVKVGDTDLVTVEYVSFAQPTPAQINRAADQIAARGHIFTEVNAERRYQTDKWGIAADDTQNTPWMWVSYITQYATKWMTGLFHVPTSSADLFRTAMIKTATTAIAAVESLDRQRARNGRAFYETAE
jgi:energy-coupling factor transporter ATP-binding protein EcfA2